MRRGQGIVLLLGLAGCQPQPTTIQDLAMAFNERQISHCLYVSGAFPPYATGYLYAQVGPLDCQRIWNWRRMQEIP